MDTQSEAPLAVDQAGGEAPQQASDPGAGQERPIPQAEEQVADVGDAPTAGFVRGQLVTFARGPRGGPARAIVALVLDTETTADGAARVRIVELGEPGVIDASVLSSV